MPGSPSRAELSPPQNLLTSSLLLPPGFPPPRVQVLVAGLTQVLHPLRVPPAARLRRVPVCDTPELPGATDGRGRTNNNRRMRAFPTTPLAALPTAPRPSLSATLIAMKFALERSVGCNFGRDRCNLGLGCLGRGRWMPERVIQVDPSSKPTACQCHILLQYQVAFRPN